jgi:hypothetical protein
MDKFDELQRELDEPKDFNGKFSRRTSYNKSFWYNISDAEKLDFNQEMASVIIEIIRDSLNKEFTTWKEFTVKMKDEKK